MSILCRNKSWYCALFLIQTQSQPQGRILAVMPAVEQQPCVFTNVAAICSYGSGGLARLSKRSPHILRLQLGFPFLVCWRFSTCAVAWSMQQQFQGAASSKSIAVMQWWHKLSVHKKQSMQWTHVRNIESTLSESDGCNEPRQRVSVGFNLGISPK